MIQYALYVILLISIIVFNSWGVSRYAYGAVQARGSERRTKCNVYSMAVTSRVYQSSPYHTMRPRCVSNGTTYSAGTVHI